MINFKATDEWYMKAVNEENIAATIPICPAVERYEKTKNGGLTNAEVADGYFMDVVLGKGNIRKALADRQGAVEDEYEAFNLMHRADGIANNKCTLSL